MPLYVPPPLTLPTGGAGSRTPDRTFLQIMSEFGPVPPTVLAGSLRPSQVRYGQGVQFDTGSTQRLNYPVEGLAAPLSLSLWFRPSATPGATKGLLQALDGTDTPIVALEYTATAVRVAGGPSVSMAVAGGDLILAVVTLGPAGIVMHAGKYGGALVSVTGGAAPATELGSLDVGMTAAGRAGAALEQVLVHASQLTADDVAHLFAAGEPYDYTSRADTVLAALTPTAPDVHALTADGEGAYAAEVTLSPVLLGRLEPGGAYTANGATRLASCPPDSGLLAGDTVRLPDGALTEVVAVVTSTTRDEAYLA